MGYYIDLKTISVDEFKERLKNSYLLPSQKILRENMDERFRTLKTQKIENMLQLQQVLKTKEKVINFAKKTSLPVDYLTVLRREVNSYHPQPRKIKDFPCLSEKTKKLLEKQGIKTTVDLYDRIVTKHERNKLINELNITNQEALNLTKLTDISRLRYVNQTFATLLINSEYNTVEKIKKADYQELHKKLIKLNEENSYFKGKIGLNDMKYFVNDTANVVLDIEY